MSLADGAPRGLHVRRPGRLWLATLAGSVAIHLAALPLLARLVPVLPWPSSLVVQLIPAPAASPGPAPAAAARERPRRAAEARSAAAARAVERERETAAHARAREAEEVRRAEAAREAEAARQADLARQAEAARRAAETEAAATRARADQTAREGPPRSGAPAAEPEPAAPPARVARVRPGTGGPGLPAVPPRILARVEPRYPATAYRLGVEGVVQVRVAIRLDGTVAEAAVVRSAGHPDLDRAAVDAVGRWRFEPARGDADPALRLADIPVRFDLRD